MGRMLRTASLKHFPMPLLLSSIFPPHGSFNFLPSTMGEKGRRVVGVFNTKKPENQPAYLLDVLRGGG